MSHLLPTFYFSPVSFCKIVNMKLFSPFPRLYSLLFPPQSIPIAHECVLALAAWLGLMVSAPPCTVLSTEVERVDGGCAGVRCTMWSKGVTRVLIWGFHLDLHPIVRMKTFYTMQVYTF